MSGAGWQHMAGSPWSQVTNSRVLLIAWKIATGSEGGTNVPGGIVATGGVTSDSILIFTQRWTAADGFRVSNPFESIGAIAIVSVTARPMPTVTPTGLNRRAVAVTVVFAASETIAGATGETGGNWLEEHEEQTTIPIMVQTQSADLTSGNEISGGTATSTSGTQGLTLGFALVPVGG